MKSVGIKEARAHLSSLFSDALNGEIVILSKNKSASVRLVPVETPLSPPTGFGMFADRLKNLPDDYWTKPEHEKEFEGLFSEHE